MLTEERWAGTTACGGLVGRGSGQAPERWKPLSLPAAWLAKHLHPKAAPQLPNVCLFHSSPDGTLGLNSNISRGINVFGLKASCMYVQVFIYRSASMYMSVHNREKLPLTDISQGLLCTQHQSRCLGTQKREQQACLPGGRAWTGVISWVLGRPPSPLHLVKLWVRSCGIQPP